LCAAPDSGEAPLAPGATAGYMANKAPATANARPRCGGRPIHRTRCRSPFRNWLHHMSLSLGRAIGLSKLDNLPSPVTLAIATSDAARPGAAVIRAGVCGPARRAARRSLRRAWPAFQAGHLREPGARLAG